MSTDIFVLFLRLKLSWNDFREIHVYITVEELICGIVGRTNPANCFGTSVIELLN